MMRYDQSSESRCPRLVLPPTCPGSMSPLVPPESQPKITNNTKAPKGPVVTMHRTPSKTHSSQNIQNVSSSTVPSAPATPRLGYRPSQATLSQNNTTIPRYPRPTVKRPGAEAGPTLAAESTTSSVASRRSSYTGPQVRPQSSLSSVSTRVEIQSGSQSLRVARSSNEPSRRPNSPKFFHASGAKQPSRRPLPPTISGDVSPSQSPRLQTQPSKFFYAVEATNTTTAHLTPRLPTTPPVTNPQTPVTSPQQLSPVNVTRNVKFVYANGTEEILEPWRKNPSTSEGSSRPPSPSPYPLSPGPVQTPSKHHSSQSSVLSSPTQWGTPLADKRTSTESKGRHGRALSVGANGQEIFLAPEVLRSPPAAPKVSGVDDTHPTANPMAMTLKMREELAANARRERKVMDLEISNASLLAINRTLERKMKKQTSELRRYRRLARSGGLKAKSQPEKQRSRTSGGAADMVEGEGKGNSEVTVEEGGVEEEEEEEDEEDESSSEGESGTTDEQTQSYNGKRAIVTTDNAKVSAELQKHQALLEASAKTDALLVRCQFMIEEMAKEAKKALDYRVAAADVKLGGRILGSDNEEEDEGSNDDNDGVILGDGEGITETEAEDEMTGTEGETTDDAGYADEGEENDDDDDDDDDDEEEKEEESAEEIWKGDTAGVSSRLPTES